MLLKGLKPIPPSEWMYTTWSLNKVWIHWWHCWMWECYEWSARDWIIVQLVFINDQLQYNFFGSHCRRPSAIWSNGSKYLVVKTKECSIKSLFWAQLSAPNASCLAFLVISTCSQLIFFQVSTHLQPVPICFIVFYPFLIVSCLSKCTFKSVNYFLPTMNP